jgi:hypothetical protein
VAYQLVGLHNGKDKEHSRHQGLRAHTTISP